MPAGINEADIQASYDSGILEVRVPMSGHESTPRRKVPVNRTDTMRTAAGEGGNVDGHGLMNKDRSGRRPV